MVSAHYDAWIIIFRAGRGAREVYGNMLELRDVVYNKAITLKSLFQRILQLLIIAGKKPKVEWNNSLMI